MGDTPATVTDAGPLTGHVIHTGPDGVLHGMGAADVGAVAHAAVDSGHVVLHFHGGLVSAEKGQAVAAELLPVYGDAGAYPVFFVWRSGLLEILRGNLSEIAGERVFKALVKVILKFVVGHVAGARVASRGDLAPPGDAEVAVALARRGEGREPYAGLEVARDVPDVGEAELHTIERLLAEEPEVRESEAAVAASATVSRDARGGAPGTRLDRRIVDEVVGERALVSGAVLARHGAKVVRNVIARFRSGRDHGVYVTVVEELLRAFYGAAAGERVWSAMKRETADTFVGGEPARGGAAFMTALAVAAGDGPMPRITLVGHSTGAVFINHLLEDADRRRHDRADALPDDFRFEHVVFLAPACTYADFAPVLARQEDLWNDLKMFTMTDVAESEDELVPVVYPRSLLYFVSGVLEGAPATPVLGLARTLERVRGNDPPEVKAVRAWLLSRQERVVLSPGERAGARRHGDFDDDPLVRRSVQALLATPPRPA